MPAHSVELVLDDAGDALVRQQWCLLAEAGLPSLASHTGETNAPHLTVAAFGSAPSTEVAERLSAAVAALPVRVRLGAPMLFGRTRLVLVRAVVPTEELLALHASVYAAAATTAPPAGPAPATGPTLLEHFAPGDWTPHVTLARGIRREQVGEALAALASDTESGADDLVAFTTARRWDPDAQRIWTL